MQKAGTRNHLASIESSGTIVKPFSHHCTRRAEVRPNLGIDRHPNSGAALAVWVPVMPVVRRFDYYR